MTASGVETEPILKPKEPGTNTCSIPLCTACLRGKGKATHVGIDKMDNPDYIDTIKDGDILPGQTVSTDQYENRLKGGLPNTRRREDLHKMYCGGILFNEYASSKIDVYYQFSLAASGTIRSKELYDQKAEEVGLKVLAYREDNEVYKFKAFLDDLARRVQTMMYSRVGAHAQNGVAERGILIIVNSARTMMLHQALLRTE